MPDDVKRPERAYGGETYHGLPSLKRSFWGFPVGAYIFLGGMCGAAQVLATLGQGLDRRVGGTVLRNARLLSLGGSTVGAGLLIWDLYTPQRFYNMFRIFRATSPMSIGTYVFGAFSLSSAVGAAAELFSARLGRKGGRVLRRAADVAQVPAALSGAGMSVYTAALLAATSTPLWAAAPRGLGARFGAGSVAAGAAALSLGERAGGGRETADALDRIALLAGLADIAATLWHEAAVRKAGVHLPARAAAAGLGAAALQKAVPVASYGLSRVLPPRFAGRLSVLSSLALLAGGLLTRGHIVEAGNATADAPRTTLRFAQPENLPRTGMARRQQGRRLGTPA